MMFKIFTKLANEGWQALPLAILALMTGAFPVKAFDIPPLYGDAIQLYSNAAPYNLNSETYTTSEVWRTAAQPDISFLPNTYNTPLVTRGTNTFLVFVDPDHRLKIAKITGTNVVQAFVDNNLYQPDEFYANHDSDPTNDVTVPDYYRVKTQDSHHAPALGIDKNGYLHIVADMHNYPRYEAPQVHLPLRYAYKSMIYWRSDNPVDISSFTFLGDQSTKCLQGTGFTYATFFNDLNGELFYASRGMQLNDLRCAPFSRYNAVSGTWSIIGGTVPGEPDHPRTFFTDGREYDATNPNNTYSKTHPTGVFDRQNQMHLVAPLLSDPTLNPWGMGADQHFVDQVLYAKSVNDGVTFTKANGTLISLPATDDPGTNQADIIYKTNGYLAVMGVVAVDYQNNPYTVVKHKFTDSTPNYSEVIGWNGSAWTNYGEIVASGSDFHLIHDPAGVMTYIPDSSASIYRFWKPDGTLRTINLPSGWGIRGVDYEYLKKTGNILGFRKDGSNDLVVVKVAINNRPGMNLVTPPAATITNHAPVITQAPLANGNNLSVRATDPDGDPLTFTWYVNYSQGTATFSPNGTAGSSNAVATFSADGTYEIKVAVSDGVNTTYSTLPLTYQYPLPAPWTNSVIGTVSANVFSRYNDPGTFTLTGAGTNIYAKADNCWYMNQPFTNSAVLTARIVSQQNTHTNARAGVLMRESTSTGARMAFMGLRASTGQAEWQIRTSTGGTASPTASNGKAAPFWVRLIRSGNSFSGYASSDGISWSQIGTTTTATMSTNYLLGLAVCSGATNLQNVSVFDHVSVIAGTNIYTLAYAAGANGSVSGETPQIVAPGASGSMVTAVANTGFSFINWSDGKTNNPRTDLNVTNSLSVTASFAINTYTLTYTAGTNGTISGSSPQTVTYAGSGTSVTAVPAPGYRFINWSDGGTNNPRLDTNVTGDITVTAAFESDANQMVTYQIGGLAGERDARWDRGILSGSTGTYSFTNTTDTNLIFTVTAVAGNGDMLNTNSTHLGVDSSARTGDVNIGRINTNEFITLSVSYVDPNGRLLALTVDQFGPYWGNAATETTVFSDRSEHSTNIVAFDHTLTNNLIDFAATGLDALTKNNTGSWTLKVSVSDALGTTTSGMGAFRLKYTVGPALPSYTLTYDAGPNGTISGTSPQTVNQGGTGTAVMAAPDTGYHFVNWSDASTANPRTDSNVTNDLSVTANFAANTYTLTYAAGSNGTISGTSPQTVNYGASGTAVTAVANSGYYFVNWSDASSANPRTDLNVTNNISVTANFAQIIPPVIVSGPSISGGGFNFQFTGTLGQHYRVEYTPVLPAPGSWQVVTNIVSLATSPCSISAPATNSSGFYRVAWVP